MIRLGLNRHMATAALAASGMLLGLAVACAQPATPARTINPEQACRDDAFRLCNDLIPDRDKVGACLRRKAGSLSKDCRTVVLGGSGHHKTSRRHHLSKSKVAACKLSYPQNLYQLANTQCVANPKQCCRRERQSQNR